LAEQAGQAPAETAQTDQALAEVDAAAKEEGA